MNWMFSYKRKKVVNSVWILTQPSHNPEICEVNLLCLRLLKTFGCLRMCWLDVRASGSSALLPAAQQERRHAPTNSDELRLRDECAAVLCGWRPVSPETLQSSSARYSQAYFQLASGRVFPDVRRSPRSDSIRLQVLFSRFKPQQFNLSSNSWYLELVLHSMFLTRLQNYKHWLNCKILLFEDQT